MRTQGFITFAMLAYLIVVGWWADSAASLAATSRINMLGGHLAMYSTFLAQYAKANPATTGQPSDAAVNAPAWFQRSPSETGYVSGGIAYAYLTPMNRADGMSIARTAGGTAVGVNDNGVLASPDGSPSGISIPSNIPTGVVVMVQP